MVRSIGAVKRQVAREIATEEREERFQRRWVNEIPRIVKGLTETEYLVFENMFEMLADLRGLASYDKTIMPTLNYAFYRSAKICRREKSDRLNMELVLERFREALKFARIREFGQNRYSHRRKLRRMNGEIFVVMRNPANDFLVN